MKAEQLIDVGSITPKLLNPHLRRAIFGAGGGTTVVNTTEEPDKVPIYICRLVSDVDILLDGTVTTLDGTTIAEGDSVLVTGQTNLWENGIYFAFTTGWVRFTGIKPAMLVTISEGTDYSDSVWILTSNTIIVGTDDIVFEKVLPVSSIADGTTLGTMLNWNETDWEENLRCRFYKNTNSSVNLMYNQNLDTINYYIAKTCTDTYTIIQIVGGANKVSYIETRSNYSDIVLQNLYANLQLKNINYNAAQKIIEITSGGSTGGDNNRFLVYMNGKIMSDSLTANTYLGANASKEIVSIPSPNLIKSMSSDITDSVGTFRNGITSLGFSTEASVIYELTVKLAFGNVSSRNGSVRMYADGTNFTFRPFIMGNFSGAAPDVIYQNDSTATQPFNMDNGNPLTFQTTGTYSIYELKGMFISSSAIPNLRLQFKTDDIGLPLVLKAYSYMKISR